MRKIRNITDHTKLLCDIGELTGLFTNTPSLQDFLQKIVSMIAEHMHTDVCSIYLYDEINKELVLRATIGLNFEFVGNLKLKLGEGLTGVALKELRPVCERHASKNPSFKYFPGLGEEEFESFLVVPIIRGTNRIGAMVIQNKMKDYFLDEDITVLRAITSQLANTIEMTKFILSLEGERRQVEAPVIKKNLKLIKGKVGSPGLAYGTAVSYIEQGQWKERIKDKLLKSFTREDFYRAVEETERQLEQFQKQIEERLSDVASLIFTAQILMMKDKNFIDAIDEQIKGGVNPVHAVSAVTDFYVRKLENINDDYLKERSHDIRDIGLRIIENMIGEDKNFVKFDERIIIARELLPSDILKLSSQKIKGVILLTGGVTAHVAILAQSLQIPLIIADVPELISLGTNIKIFMDAEQGNIYIEPSAEILNSYQRRQKASEELSKVKGTIVPETRTQDGTRIRLMANINLLGDLKNANEFKAEGIGLYRTEFPFIIRNDFPSEEEQYVIYKKLVDGMPGAEVTFRTLDIGGDKVLSYFDHHLKEKNPYMGMRSIRFSLQHPEIFSQQIRAILRAGVGHKVRIMFPMISSLEDFRQAKDVVFDCIKELKKQKIAHHDQPALGLMIELPSVVEIIGDLAQEADFFSIGTNDFIQYMLAVDRTNEKVADLYLPYHPSILRGLKKIVQAAVKFKKDVSICGDMAREVQYLNFFIGIGVKKFSLNPIYIPRVQEAIKKIDVKRANLIAKALAQETEISKIKSLINQP